MSYQFSSNQYMRSHGKEPRGKGYWFFAVIDRKNGEETFIWEAQIFGTLTEAKRKATAEAKAAGVPNFSTITICP